MPAGPLFDHFAIEAFPAPVAGGGPLFIHIVPGIPASLNIQDPSTIIVPEPVRNTIVPKFTELNSPGAYGFEKTPSGNLIGFEA